MRVDSPLSSPNASQQASQQTSLISLEKARSLARLLDEVARVPGTNFRFGFDPILNLLPVAGDAVGVSFSAYLLVCALQMRVPKRVIALMFLNIALDATVGAIPLLGRVFDFVWKANMRNLALLERYAQTPEPVKQGAGRAIAVVAVGFVCLLFAILWIAFTLFQALASALGMSLW